METQEGRTGGAQAKKNACQRGEERDGEETGSETEGSERESDPQQLAMLPAREDNVRQGRKHLSDVLGKMESLQQGKKTVSICSSQQNKYNGKKENKKINKRSF